jgi:hypothetical protein
MMGGLPLLPVVITTVVVLVLVLSFWMVWTANRLDKLHLRCEAAKATLEQAAIRRSVAAQELSLSGLLGDPASTLLVVDAAAAALEPTDGNRWLAESDLTAALHLVEIPVDGPVAGQLADAARRLTMARRIHNDVVASTLALRSRRRVSWFHLAGHAAAPSMVAFDDRAP